jgi:hypothetical protein
MLFKKRVVRTVFVPKRKDGENCRMESILRFAEYYYCDQIKEDEIDGYVARMGMHTDFWSENLKGGEHL